MKFIYNGEDERVFPTLSLTVAPGETFDAPDDFTATNVTAVSGATKIVATDLTSVVDTGTIPTSVDNTQEPTPTVGE